MTATLTPTPDLPEIDAIDLKPKRSGRSVRNGIATALMRDVGWPRQRHPRDAGNRAGDGNRTRVLSLGS